MTEPPAALVAAVTVARDLRARHAAGLEALHHEMRQARKAGASISQLVAWTGYSRRRVIQITGHLQDRGA